jgi:hydroxylamine dehydrogenase
MSLKFKQFVIAVLGFAFLGSLIYVQAMEVERKREESGEVRNITVPSSSRRCVSCHDEKSPGITAHWRDSTHAEKGVACVDCHQADQGDADAFDHEGVLIATVVTPKDCARCHKAITEEFEGSHHAKAGNILASLDNFLAETVEGNRTPFNPHGKTPGRPDIQSVNGMASAAVGCKQCHGSKVALLGTDGEPITVTDLKPDQNGKPTNAEAVSRIAKNQDGKPLFDSRTWPNTGIGRLNLDGSRGSCSACHSRHDFSPRRARRPENCGKCHLGPDHPQKEIYEESKHGIAYRDLKDKMGLEKKSWVLGEDYSHAPTCATCHMSANTKNGRKITHDPGKRLSWTNRPWESRVLDTDINGKIVLETDPVKRRALVHHKAADKRREMKNVCLHCHTNDYVNGFYKQYDDFLVLYNEKFARPGKMIMDALLANKLRTPANFDEKIEWTWFYLWHHEGRRARHGAAMMAPDYAHWHGMFEVAERFYMGLIPEAREMAKHGAEAGKTAEAAAVIKVIEAILSRPEHQWRNKKGK